MVRIRNQQQFYNANGADVVGKIIDTAKQVVGTSEYIQETWKQDDTQPVYSGQVTSGGTTVDVKIGEPKPVKKILGMPQYVFYPVAVVSTLALAYGIYKLATKKK